MKEFITSIIIVCVYFNYAPRDVMMHRKTREPVIEGSSEYLGKNLYYPDSVSLYG